jgi:SAM-dependent methyltransferase
MAWASLLRNPTSKFGQEWRPGLNYEHLELIRKFEANRILDQFPAGQKVLEIGGGTGEQARFLSEAGVNIVSIDLESSNYSDHRVFPVLNYDGKHIPFNNAEFDIVYSSNVLEHVTDLEQLSKEVIRVLKPGGVCIHVMPTATWRFWTAVTQPPVNIARDIVVLKSLLFGSARAPEAPASAGVSAAAGARPRKRSSLITRLMRTIWAAVWPCRHGETGNWVTELWTFSHWWWIRAFRRHGFRVISWTPGGLFYAGNQVFGLRLSMKARQRLARFLGSACIIYRVTPSAESGSTPSAR